MDMAALGEAAAAATGQAPATIVFGAAGSAKLAHALGMHGLQVLGVLAIGLGMRPPPARDPGRVDDPRGRRVRGGVRGGDRHRVRGPGLDLAHRPLALLTLAGVVAVLAASAVVAGRLLPGVGRQRADAAPPLPESGRQRAGVMK